MRIRVACCTADPRLVAHQMWIATRGLVTLELGRYLIMPYDADTCFHAQMTSLMLGAGDTPTATTRSIRRALDQHPHTPPVMKMAMVFSLRPLVEASGFEKNQLAMTG